MASISGSLTATFIPEHAEAVKEVLAATEAAIKEAAEKQGFTGIVVSYDVGEGSGWLSVSLSKIG